MRYPNSLPQNGTIGCIAPSFGCNIEPYRSAFENAQKTWKEMGYKILTGPNCYEGSGIGISNTPELCAAEVNHFFAEEDCDVILSCGGGELMCEVVSHIDFERIARAKAKWFMGFSDNTNLTFLLPTLCDTAAIYGPCAPAFGMREWHPALNDAWGILTGEKKQVQGYPLWEKESKKDEEHPLEPYHVTEKKTLVVWQEGKSAAELEEFTVKGRLIGGCLDCLDTLVGTRFDKVAEFNERYKEDGMIWFMEACDLNPMGIRRALWQLKEAGWFQHVKAFLIGRPLCFGEEFLGLDQYRAVYDVLKKFKVPVIMDADLGHLPPSMPIISGGLAEVSVEERKIGRDLVIQYL